MAVTTPYPKVTPPTRTRIQQHHQCCEDLHTLSMFARPALDSLLNEQHDRGACVFAYDAAKRFCHNWEQLNMARREAEGMEAGA